MKLAYYHVATFTKNLFAGNPAAVCVLTEWPAEQLLQKMARENALPATAFICREADQYTIRWFGPEAEIELCGHGSIAAAHVIFHCLELERDAIVLQSPRYSVQVKRTPTQLILNLPQKVLAPATITAEIVTILGLEPCEYYYETTALAVLANEQQVRRLQLNVAALRQFSARNLIITSQGAEVDFVSRNFYPKKAVIEDPVTGSAHCILAPYWARRLCKTYLTARQISARGGELSCELLNDKVYIGGNAVLYQQGEIKLPL